MWWSRWAASGVSTPSLGNRSVFTLSLRRQWAWEAGPAYQVPPSSSSVIGQEPSLEPIRARYWQLSESVTGPAVRVGPISLNGGLIFHVSGGIFLFLPIGRHGELNRKYLSYSSKEF